MERGAWLGFSLWGCKSPDLSTTEHARKDNDPLELFNTKTPGLSNQDNKLNSISVFYKCYNSLNAFPNSIR